MGTAERDEAIVVSAGLCRLLDVGPRNPKKYLTGKLDIEVAADQTEPRRLAALVGKPAEQKTEAGFRNEKAIDRAGKRYRFAADQLVAVFVNAKSKIMIECILRRPRFDGLSRVRVGFEVTARVELRNGYRQQRFVAMDPSGRRI